MNASALLTSQGWLGPGHALDARLTDYGAQTYKQKGHRGLAYDPNAPKSASEPGQLATGNGLIRPLLVSQRHGSKYGIGKKSHEPASGNEWWLKGFASALANVGKSESERSSAVSSGTSTPRYGTSNGYVGKHSGLYNYFTSGTVMKGTIESSEDQISASEQSDTDSKTTRKSKKRKSDVLDEKEATSNNPLAVSPVKRPQTAKDLETSIPYLTERDKSRKKSHKHGKTNSDSETFAVIGTFLGATDPLQRDNEEVNVVGVSEARRETKEERAARRRRRKEEKEMEKSKENGKTNSRKGLTLAQMVEEELAKLSSMDNTEDSAADSNSDTSRTNQKTSSKTRKKKKKEREGSKVY